MSLDLFKAFTVSKIKVYFDGDPQPYIASVTVPAISSAVDSFNNTSTGGEIEVADPWRRFPAGDVEVMFEADNKTLNDKIYQSNKITSINVAMAQSNMQPQAGEFVPLPVNYKMGVQFYEVDPGEIVMGQKREITAKGKMFSLKIEYNLITVVDYDFANGDYKVGNTDLFATISNFL